MDPVLLLHVVGAALLIGVNVTVGIWGLVRSRAGAAPSTPGRERLFAHALALSQTSILGVGLMGVFLLGTSAPDDPLHARVYGPFMIAAVLAAYGFRTSDARWNMRAYSLAALLVAMLGVRAFVTG